MLLRPGGGQRACACRRLHAVRGGLRSARPRLELLSRCNELAAAARLEHRDGCDEDESQARHGDVNVSRPDSSGHRSAPHPWSNPTGPLRFPELREHLECSAHDAIIGGRASRGPALCAFDAARYWLDLDVVGSPGRALPRVAARPRVRGSLPPQRPRSVVPGLLPPPHGAGVRRLRERAPRARAHEPQDPGARGRSASGGWKRELRHLARHDRLPPRIRAGQPRVWVPKTLHTTSRPHSSGI